MNGRSLRYADGLATVVLALTDIRSWALVTRGALGMFFLHGLQGV